MYAGDTSFPFSEVMRRTETWIGFTNSDGWAAGDLDAGPNGGPGFVRANDNGADLNRDLATVGWYDRTGGRGIAESEPETRAWTTIVKSLPNLKTSTDIHGELTTPNDAFSDLIIPAGQWTPKRQDQVNQLSLDMIKTVERKFAEDGVVLNDIFGPLPGDGATPRKAANVAAAYDIVGYDDSGFMGDWFSQTQDSVHMDVENFLSNAAPNNVWVPQVEQAHVAAVRGNIEATIVEALITEDVRPSADYGKVAYVDDPGRTSSSPSVQDGVPGTGSPVVQGETQTPYDVSRMDYYDTLRKAFGAQIDPVHAADVAAGKDFSAFDTLVVTDMKLPRGSTVDLTAYTAGLKAFAEGGGQLVLTDRGLGLLDDLGVVDKAALTVDNTDAGHVDFVAPVGDHPYEKGLVGAPSQIYYEVMLGYPSRQQAPNYGIERAAWEAAGGTTVATVGPQGRRLPQHRTGQPDDGQGPGHGLRRGAAAGRRAAARHRDTAPPRPGLLRRDDHRWAGAGQRAGLPRRAGCCSTGKPRGESRGAAGRLDARLTGGTVVPDGVARFVRVELPGSRSRRGCAQRRKRVDRLRRQSAAHRRGAGPPAHCARGAGRGRRAPSPTSYRLRRRPTCPAPSAFEAGHRLVLRPADAGPAAGGRFLTVVAQRGLQAG